MREIFLKFNAEEQFDQNELVTQLGEMKESLRQEYHVGKTFIYRVWAQRKKPLAS